MCSIKVGLVLLSNSAQPAPSTRIAVLNMLPYLSRAGYEVSVLFEPADSCQTPDLDGVADRAAAQGLQLVIFQKVFGASAARCARALGACGIATMYVVCDFVQEEMADACDVTVTVTDFLRTLYPARLQSRIRVVHDGIEQPALRKPAARADRGSWWRPLKAVLVTASPLMELPCIGLPPPWLQVDIIAAYPSRARPWYRLRWFLWQLRTRPSWRQRLATAAFLLSPRIRCVPWSPAQVERALPAADIALIPVSTALHVAGQPTPAWMTKSENRLTMKMSVGLPVVASPVPSYLDIVVQGDNGYLARTAAEWTAILAALRDPALRQRVGVRARATVTERYSMEEQAARLLAIMDEVLAGARVAHGGRA